MTLVDHIKQLFDKKIVILSYLKGSIVLSEKVSKFLSASGRDWCMSNSNTSPYASVGFSGADFSGTCVDSPADLHVSCLTIIFAYPT